MEIKRDRRKGTIYFYFIFNQPQTQMKRPCFSISSEAIAFGFGEGAVSPYRRQGLGQKYFLSRGDFFNPLPKTNKKISLRERERLSPIV